MAGIGRTQNLKSTDKMKPEELREFSRKGGKASVIAKRQQKALKELANLILSKAARGKLRQQMKEALPDLDAEDMTYKSAMVFGQIQAAINGNTRAFKQIQETIGETPKGDSRVEDKIDTYFDQLEEAFKE